MTRAISADAFRNSRVLVIGDIALDRFVYGSVERISPEAPVPILRVGATRDSLGCAANVAADVAALGAHAVLIGLIGQDREAGEIETLCRGHGGAIELIPVRAPNYATTLKTRYIAGDQQIMRADREVTTPIERPQEEQALGLFKAALERCDVVVVSDYDKGFLTDHLLQGVIEAARSANRPVLVDPKRTRLDCYYGATLIKPNRAELKVATGLPCERDEDAEVAADMAIAETGAMLLLTRSDRGMSLYRPGLAPVHARAVAREIFDVSGAGDTVIGVVAAALAAGIDVEDAMHIANAAAGIVVGKVGTATVSAPELAAALSAGRHGFDSRIVPLETAIAEREAWRRSGLTCGFTNGCFDLIHPGHISLLAQAKRTCDRLIVALNSDASVRRLKGPERPIQGEEARAFVMASIEHVDLVVIFEQDTPLELIRALRPDVLIKGADYREEDVVGADLVKSWGGRLVLAELVPNASTTSMVTRRSGAGEPDPKRSL